jgi:hypothetical protein
MTNPNLAKIHIDQSCFENSESQEDVDSFMAKVLEIIKDYEAREYGADKHDEFQIEINHDKNSVN